jgi:hypothetical protein
LADTQSYYIRFLAETHREADVARKPREALWRDAWRTFHNEFDYTKKAPWQTKLRWSRFAGTVETFVAILKRAMIEARTWWIVEGVDDVGKERAPLIKRLVDLWLRTANFVVLFTDGLKLGAIADLIVLKATWPQWEEQDVAVEEVGTELAGLGAPSAAPRLITRKRAGLKVELLDPFKVWLDPTGRNRYVIEDSETDFDELQTLARLNPQAWDRDAIDRLAAATQEAQARFDERRRQGLEEGTVPPWRKPVKLRTFTGDVVNEDTFSVERNVTFTVANDSELVGRVRPIPYWHVMLDRRIPNKRGPYIWGFPFRIPLAPYGKGLGRDNLDLAMAITELHNSIGDQALFDGLNAYEVDRELIYDPEEFKDGVYPGKTFTKREGSGGRPLIEPRKLGQISAGTLNAIALYDRDYQNSTGVTNYVEPAVPSRQTGTLGEYQGRQSQSLGLLDMVARNLEDQLLEPFLETVYWLILQYMDDFTIPDVVDVLGPDAAMLAAMPAPMRFQYLKSNVRFSARGMSVVLSKQEELQKLGLFLQGAQGLRQFVPDLERRINGDAILRKSIEALGWDPDEVLVKPQETAIEQEALATAPQPVPSGIPAAPPMPAAPEAPLSTAGASVNLTSLADLLGPGQSPGE